MFVRRDTQSADITFHVFRWSDADALAKVNADLISNFIEGLKFANLTPKRFLLQTGAKQYGFHIGPATSPSFESDPSMSSQSVTHRLFRNGCRHHEVRKVALELTQIVQAIC